ncbi:MAG TPA: glycosyltransferase family 87 protein [Anaerolineae bacterium]|nr:glycosyltransferase family 87 protein [Anaerolineae bacterium]
MASQISSPSKHPGKQLPLVWLILGLLVILLIAVESFALYTVFTSQFPSGNDFFVRWLGGREYLLHGTNPYDRTVAEQAQISMFGRLAQPGDKDEAYFAYPLYTLFFFWPLSLLPYAWAQAVWMAILQFMLLGLTILSTRLARWSPPNWLFWFTVFWGIFFYNGARAILLGQFSIMVGLALLLALWAIEKRRDTLAGLCLAITTIKPQMVFLILAFLLLWAVVRGRWHIVLGFGLSMLGLVFGSILLIPSWPVDFARNALAYSDYVAFGTPLENLLDFLLPPSLAGPLTSLLSGLFFLALLPGWWLAFRDRPGAYTWAVMSTLIVGSLITFRSATTNQVILYLPLFFFFQRLPASKATLVAFLTQIGLLVLMWSTFVVLLDGNWEHTMMHGLLPALMLLLYALDWRKLRRGAARVEQLPLQPQLGRST